MRLGNHVIYSKEMKGLPFGEIGEIIGINGDNYTIYYSQFAPVERNGKILFSNFVYIHSAKQNELTIKTYFF